METNLLLRVTVVTALAVVAFAPCLGGTFVFDDIPAVIENRMVHAKEANLSFVFMHDFWGEPATSDKSHGSYRPLTTLLFREQMHSLELQAKTVTVTLTTCTLQMSPPTETPFGPIKCATVSRFSLIRGVLLQSQNYHCTQLPPLYNVTVSGNIYVAVGNSHMVGD